MKLGIIAPPEAASIDHAKELGLDFVEFDCNPTDFFGVPVEELQQRQASIKEASERTGVEVGAVGRWASHILDQNGDVIPEEWNNVVAVMDFGQYLGDKYYLCSCRRQRAGHGMRHCQLHDGRQLHPHPGAVEAGPQRSARLGHQVRSLPQLCARRSPGRLHGREHGVGFSV